MGKHDPVIWSEGMLLSPQHFQQWDRYVHHLVGERFRCSNVFEWGLTGLEFDEDALHNGRLAVSSAAGVFPDGTPFSVPSDDEAPAPRELESAFGGKTDEVSVHLGLPAARSGRAAVGEMGEANVLAPRFSARTVELPDDTTGEDERPVTLGRRNLRLLLPGEALADHEVIPVARVRRTSEGSFALSEEFVPPCLAIGASQLLLRRMRSALEKLVSKSIELSNRRRQRGGVADFSSAESANFWMLHTVNSVIPVVSHLVGHHRSHPEQVYLALAGLHGALCTFSAEIHTRDAPAYEHADLAHTFDVLLDQLSQLLDTVIPTKAVTLPLEARDGSLNLAHVQDGRLLETGAQIFLGVRADVEEQQLVTEVPVKVKVASLDKIDILVANALRGVPLNFVRVPPASLPVKASYVYFELDSNSEIWEGIRSAKNIAIYAPPDYPGMSLELLGIRE